ncbi:aminodeoxychorismate/anthranilate synthase component II [Halosquirtibacter xylanolyticus]|uniref:anthranilate synthase component II n=1 Tax=Halosquirtibacter xylanolyticus TaxID=3374599 RepID=UPI00374A747D|nr:aminodeoxychorismate/anthranilate synthase component II [Prolixibacteraceae bacterium]
MVRVLIIDNDDSFTYNLRQLVEEAEIQTEEVIVISHKDVTLDDVAPFSHIIFSPGPSLPKDHPMMFEILEAFEDTKVILGVCLGHQAIGAFYGAKLSQLKQVVHGQQREIIWDSTTHPKLSLPSPSIVGLYHSWFIDSIPEAMPLHITAADPTGRIMAIEHHTFAITGVQFHPESMMTEQGDLFINKWLSQTV